MYSPIGWRPARGLLRAANLALLNDGSDTVLPITRRMLHYPGAVTARRPSEKNFFYPYVQALPIQKCSWSCAYFHCHSTAWGLMVLLWYSCGISPYRTALIIYVSDTAAGWCCVSEQKIKKQCFSKVLYRCIFTLLLISYYNIYTPPWSDGNLLFCKLVQLRVFSVFKMTLLTHWFWRD